MTACNRITVTGADERTDIDSLVELVNEFPSVEVGLLYTANPEGRPRYPGRHWLQQAASKLAGRVAIHVCGGDARRELLRGDLSALTRYAPRVQVNGLMLVHEAEVLSRLVGTLITQHNVPNGHLLRVRAKNHAVLIDSSGGRGVSPELWEAPATEKAYGFAGGLGPANLAAEMAGTAALATPASWWDMEGKLRVWDWFSVDLARQCAAIARDFSITPAAPADQDVAAAAAARARAPHGGQRPARP